MSKFNKLCKLLSEEGRPQHGDVDEFKAVLTKVEGYINDLYKTKVEILLDDDEDGFFGDFQLLGNVIALRLEAGEAGDKDTPPTQEQIKITVEKDGKLVTEDWVPNNTEYASDIIQIFEKVISLPEE